MEYLISLGIIAIIFFRQEIIDAIASVVTTYWWICLGLFILLVWAAVAFVRRAERATKRKEEEIERIKGERWADAYPYQGDLAPVKNQQGLWGFVDKEGEIFYDPEFDGLEFYTRREGDFWMCWTDGEYRIREFIATDGEPLDWWKVQDTVKHSTPQYYAGEIDLANDLDDGMSDLDDDDSEEKRDLSEVFGDLWLAKQCWDSLEQQHETEYDDDE